MTKRKGEYENIQAKADRGEYTLVDPLDYLILEILPDEGELVMGFYPFAKSSAQLTKERFTTFTPPQMAQDVRRLLRQRLAIQVRIRASESGWQRTARGKKVYEDWKRNQPESKKEEKK